MKPSKTDVPALSWITAMGVATTARKVFLFTQKDALCIGRREKINQPAKLTGFTVTFASECPTKSPVKLSASADTRATCILGWFALTKNASVQISKTLRIKSWKNESEILLSRTN